MVTGHEEEFRQLFIQEAESQLANMGQKTLDLEAGGQREEIVAELFREAHTLKSSSALVGFDAVSVVAHALEDLFEELRSGGRRADGPTVDAILSAIDTIREMIPALGRGEDRSGVASRAEAALRSVPSAGEGPAEGVAPPTLYSSDRADSGFVSMPVERLDSIVRLAGEAVAARLGVGAALTRAGAGDPDAVTPYAELGRTLDALRDQALKARMVTFGTIAEPLRRAVREMAGTDKRARLELVGQATELDRHVLERLRDPLLHLVRNALSHGIEPAAEREALGKPPDATVRVAAEPRGHEVHVSVSDDGRGIDLEGLRSLGGEGDDPLKVMFRAGVSTAPEVTGVAGRGVGLDVVRTALDQVRGRIEVLSEPGKGATFDMAVPITLAVVPCLVVAAGEERYAIPLHSAHGIVEDSAEADLTVEGRPSLRSGDELIQVSSLAGVLGLGDGDPGPAIVLGGATRRHAFRVRELLGRRDVVVKELGPVVGRLETVIGAAVEPDGTLILVLDPAGLVARGRAESGPSPAPAPSAAEPAGPLARVLVVDDAVTVRELQRSILKRAGYEVEVAVDGQAALAALASQAFDLVLTDVEMPRMDGFQLTETIRAQPQLAGLPVIIITARSDEAGRRRGLEVGADGYIIKSAFDEARLLEAVERVLGEGE